jgi:hypothetical protein
VAVAVEFPTERLTVLGMATPREVFGVAVQVLVVTAIELPPQQLRTLAPVVVVVPERVPTAVIQTVTVERVALELS